MKSNKEILNAFGQLVATECFDPSYGNLKSLRIKENPPKIFEEYVSLFKKMSDQDFKILERYMRESIVGTLHDFLRIFEEHENFKLVYQEGVEEVNLNETSKMLKAEPLLEDGWIERFSKEINRIDSE